MPFLLPTLRSRRGVALLLSLLALSLLPAAAPAPDRDLGKEVVAYCRANVGKQVGDGECATLADRALSEVGAAHRGADDPDPGDYTWGRQVLLFEGGSPKPKATGRLIDVRPGDIIQARGAHFAGRDRKVRNGFYTMTMEHHTAVVVGLAPGGAVVVFHQNVSGKRQVMQDTFYLNDLKQGWLRFYRPEPPAE